MSEIIISALDIDVCHLDDVEVVLHLRLARTLQLVELCLLGSDHMHESSHHDVQPSHHRNHGNDDTGCLGFLGLTLLLYLAHGGQQVVLDGSNVGVDGGKHVGEEVCGDVCGSVLSREVGVHRSSLSHALDSAHGSSHLGNTLGIETLKDFLTGYLLDCLFDGRILKQSILEGQTDLQLHGVIPVRLDIIEDIVHSFSMNPLSSCCVQGH